MLRTRRFGILFLIFVLLGSSQRSLAVWNGVDAKKHPRAVPLLFTPLETYCASGFLYSPRIVFTAGHSVFEGNDLYEDQVKLRSNLWVGFPGETISFGSKRVSVEKMFVSNKYKGRDRFPWSSGSRITRQYDFAVFVLKEPLPVDNKKVELLTPKLHDSYISSREEISSTGYGAQSADQLNKACDGRNPKTYTSSITAKEIPPQNGLVLTSTLNFIVAPYQPNGCDGDSGSGYYKELEDKYIYLGAMGAGAWMNHNCETFQEAIGRETINAADPVYLFLDLIKQAEDYVAANPYIAPPLSKETKKKKISYSCISKNGKDVKGVYERYKVKCPKGYKKL